jgi:hypothetical protein
MKSVLLHLSYVCIVDRKGLVCGFKIHDGAITLQKNNERKKRRGWTETGRMNVDRTWRGNRGLEIGWNLCLLDWAQIIIIISMPP